MSAGITQITRSGTGDAPPFVLLVTPDARPAGVDTALLGERLAHLPPAQVFFEHDQPVPRVLAGLPALELGVGRLRARLGDAVDEHGGDEAALRHAATGAGAGARWQEAGATALLRADPHLRAALADAEANGTAPAVVDALLRVAAGGLGIVDALSRAEVLVAWAAQPVGVRRGRGIVVVCDTASASALRAIWAAWPVPSTANELSRER